MEMFALRTCNACRSGNFVFELGHKGYCQENFVATLDSFLQQTSVNFFDYQSIDSGPDLSTYWREHPVDAGPLHATLALLSAYPCTQLAWPDTNRPINLCMYILHLLCT
jgi:hypothetical protein